MTAMWRRFASGTLIIATGLSGCGRSPDEANRIQNVSMSVDQAGGRLASKDGVVLVVPKGVLTQPANATIHRQGVDEWDVHIDRKWTGLVEVTLPPSNFDASLALFAHQVDGEWGIERASNSSSSVTAQLGSLSPIKLIKCLGKLTRSAIARCMVEAGVKKLLLKKITSDTAKKVLEALFPQCTVIDGIIDFVKFQTLGEAPPAECSATDGDARDATSGSSVVQPPGGAQVANSPQHAGGRASSNLVVHLTEDPFVCNGSSRRMGFISGAQAGSAMTFTSPELGKLSTGRAGADGNIPLRWICQPDDAGTKWRVNGSGTDGGSVSFTVVGAASRESPTGDGQPHTEVDVLGDVDVERYCFDGWGLHAVLREQSAYGWRCAGKGAPDQHVSMDDACEQQHTPQARSKYLSSEDPNSWRCVS